MPRNHRVTDKQWRFVEEYLIDLNATKAAVRAGFSPKSAEKYANQLLHTSHIRNAVDQAIAERSRRTGIHQDRVIQELARVAFINPEDIIDFQTGCVKPGASDDDVAVIASCKVKVLSRGDNKEIVEREVKLADKVKALDMLCRHLGMYAGKSRLACSSTTSGKGKTGIVQIPAVAYIQKSPLDDESKVQQ